MPFQKGRTKTGGRPNGTPRKVRLAVAVAEKLEELGFDPLLHAHKLIHDPKTPVEVAAKLTIDIMGFVWPKKKAVEHTGLDGTTLVSNQITIEFVQPSERTIPSGSQLLIPPGEV